MKKENQPSELNETIISHNELWDTWIKTDNCFLTESEIKAVEYYILKELLYSGAILFSYKMKNNLPLAERLFEWQRIEYHHYKNTVIYGFIFSIIGMAEKRDREDFFETPIKELKIIDDLKTELIKLKIITLKDFFAFYSEKCLGKQDF